MNVLFDSYTKIQSKESYQLAYSSKYIMLLSLIAPRTVSKFKMITNTHFYIPSRNMTKQIILHITSTKRFFSPTSRHDFILYSSSTTNNKTINLINESSRKRFFETDCTKSNDQNKKNVINKMNRRRFKQKAPKLAAPTFIHSDEHLIAVNKPEGWHSIPNDIPTIEKEKCLLSYIKKHFNLLITKLYLQSNQMIHLPHDDKMEVKPLHRIDQPCSGLLLLSRTKQAARNITKLWKSGLVRKEYLCLVYGNIKTQATTYGDGGTIKCVIPQKGKEYVLTGILRIRPRTKGKSVIVDPLSHYLLPSNTIDAIIENDNNRNGKELKKGHRLCQMHYRILSTYNVKKTNITLSLISVRTFSGARHQVRAMLSYLLQTPVLGDLRYNLGSHNHDDCGYERDYFPLPNQGVTLHARKLRLPCDHTTDYKRSDDKDVDVDTHFIAPIPKYWTSYFGLSDTDVCRLEQKWGFKDG